MILPTGKDIKAARNYVDWTQSDLAKRCGLSTVSVNQIEKCKQEATKDVLENIKRVFSEKNIVFVDGGGFRVDDNPVRIITGREAFLKLQEDMIETVAFNGEEILYFGSNEKKSIQKIIDNEIRICKLGIPTKTLASIHDDYFMGDLKDYRLIDPKYFSNNVTVIYKNKVAYNITSENVLDRVIIIKNQNLADSFKEQFYKLWSEGVKPKKTTASLNYFNILNKNDK